MASDAYANSCVVLVLTEIINCGSCGHNDTCEFEQKAIKVEFYLNLSEILRSLKKG